MILRNKIEEIIWKKLGYYETSKKDVAEALDSILKEVEMAMPKE